MELSKRIEQLRIESISDGQYCDPTDALETLAREVAEDCATMVQECDALRAWIMTTKEKLVMQIARDKIAKAIREKYCK